MIDTDRLDVARDLLDKQLRDRAGRPMGRADSVALTLLGDGRLRVDAIVIGPVALAQRASPRLGRWAAALERWLRIPGKRPTVVPLDKLSRQGVEIAADVLSGETAAMVLEQRLQRWLARIPGSR